ncbi:hypothetical protein [Ideonella sp.]|uniref:hypothetical protein n=1 Tax=Ideonella sp. TaxID=1929293 RepID=UPI0035B1ACE2
MLRALVAALLVANLLFWAWHHPPVAQALGLGGQAEGREPERLQRQVRPEAIRVLPAERGGAPREVAVQAALAGEPGPASAPAPGPAGAGVCVEAGPLGEVAAQAALRELTGAGVAAGAWVDMQRELPGRWVVYMGRYTDREAMRRKGEELAGLGVTATELRRPAELAPGLALGEFGARADAQARLDRLQARGVRTARLVQLPSAGVEHRLRVDRLEPAAAERLAAQSARPGATRWQPCAP